jgi:hypothetical protein
MLALNKKTLFCKVERQIILILLFLGMGNNMLE